MKAGWTKKRLGEVVEVQNGFAFDSKGFSPSKGVPLVRIRSLKQGFETETRFDGDYDERYLVHAGDLLIGMDGEFGCYEWRGERALLNQRVCRLHGFSSELLPRFLLYGVNSHLKAIEDVTGYSTVKHLSSKQILAIEFPIPPIPEQRRIVALLDAAFEGIATAAANAERNLQSARDLFESHLADVFSRRGEGWVETTLGAEVDLLSGFAFKSSFYTEATSGIRLLRGDNIVQGRLRWEDSKRWPAAATAEYQRFQLCEGDVVLAMDRPWVNAGLKRAQISKEDLPCLLVQRTARLRTGRLLASRFLYFLVSSYPFARHIVGSQTGSGVPHISGQQIKEFRFRRPPIEAQMDLAAQLDAISAESDRLSALYEQKQAALEALKRSLLQRAFNGAL